jgi:hypothetical protein
MADTADGHVITYTFVLKDGRHRVFRVNLDPQTLLLRREPRATIPEWTRLSSFACSHCPLAKEEHPHCPLAVSLLDLIEFFGDAVSHQPADITVETPERTSWKATSTQAGMSSLLGIYMVSSGCPVMAKLRPMVRFHLPFATVEETTYRALSMYVMAQFFIQQGGGKADWSLQGLARIYDDVHVVNVNVSEKLGAQRLKDASMGAISTLDTFGSMTAFSITEDMLEDVRALFSAYLPPG